MEILAILTTAKEAGFDTGTIMALTAIAFKLRSDVKKEVSKQVDKVCVAIAAHNKRIDSLEESVSDLKKRMGDYANR